MTCNTTCGTEPMGLGLLGAPDALFNRKFRWLFGIRGDAGDQPTTILTLPSRRANRPMMGWKEYEFQHLTETIFYPLKPSWEPIDVTLYDVRECGPEETRCNPIFKWIRDASTINQPGMYDPELGNWQPIIPSQFKRTGDIYILSGTGGRTEHWVLDNCYPQHVRWGELDMDSSDVLTVEVTLRYDRAYCVT